MPFNNARGRKNKSRWILRESARGINLNSPLARARKQGHKIPAQVAHLLQATKLVSAQECA
jgi:hypothetical protein